MGSYIYNAFAVALPLRLNADQEFLGAMWGLNDPHIEASAGVLVLERHVVGVVLPDRSGITYDTHKMLAEAREKAMDAARQRSWTAISGTLGFGGDPAAVSDSTEKETASSVGGWDEHDPFASEDPTAHDPRFVAPDAQDILVAFAVANDPDSDLTTALEALRGQGVATFGPGCGINSAQCWALAAYPGTAAGAALQQQAAAWRLDEERWVEAALFAFCSGVSKVLDATRLPSPEPEANSTLTFR